MFAKLKVVFDKEEDKPCEHEYQYMTVPVACGAMLTWYWCNKCGESKPRDWEPKNEKS